MVTRRGATGRQGDKARGDMERFEEKQEKWKITIALCETQCSQCLPGKKNNKKLTA
jgi:hypothetical protein